MMPAAPEGEGSWSAIEEAAQEDVSHFQLLELGQRRPYYYLSRLTSMIILGRTTQRRQVDRAKAWSVKYIITGELGLLQRL
jgi:hypothetical protein